MAHRHRSGDTTQPTDFGSSIAVANDGSSAGLSEFEAALSAEYGQHTATARAAHYCARFAKPRFGPFEVGVAAGRSFAWTRKRAGLAERWHENIFLVHQLDGRSTVNHAGRSVDMRPCDMTLIDPIGPCDFEFNGHGTLVSYGFPRRHLNNINLPSDAVIARRINGSDGFGLILSSYLSSMLAVKADFDQTDMDILSGIVFKMLDRYQNNGGFQQSQPAACSKLERLREWAIENLALAQITPEVMARACAVSRRKLYRLFEDTGMTPQHWLWQLRLEVAHQRLQRHDGRTITDIAFSVGFNDAAHFSRAFRNAFGTSPSAIRKTS
ncbi:AraC-like DNA-binding protein [Novosphingobium sp. 1529]|uniref:helix-turn-helix domain-containing protein n=1 Tax=Novosphingobium sp. 1529 TaxID=3156424 RepID=UPI003398E4B3